MFSLPVLHFIAQIAAATVAGVVAGYVMGRIDGRHRGYVDAHKDLNRDRRERMTPRRPNAFLWAVVYLAAAHVVFWTLVGFALLTST